MRVALVQLDPTVADVEGNTQRIIDHLERHGASADLHVFGELAVPGYPPTDFVEREDFRARCLAANDRIVEATSGGPAVIFGTIVPADPVAARWSNAAVVVRDGRVAGTARKALLPTYDVFDETRFFTPGRDACVVELGGLRWGVGICEDFWWVPERDDPKGYATDVAAELAGGGADVLVNLSASPWHRRKVAQRHEIVGGAARRVGRDVLYANLVGGNDDLLFDGRSLAWDRDGREIARAAAWRADVIVFDVDASGRIRPAEGFSPRAAPGDGSDEDVALALSTGVADFCRKCGVERVLLGLSGGVDSAVTAAVAVHALGPERVTGVALPSAISSGHSLADARELAENLGIRLDVLPIQPAVDALCDVVRAGTGEPLEGLAHENIQARTRGALLMALCNREQAMLLATGNKAELATGYCTLYGDMAGGLAVIGDLLKGEVVAVGRALDRMAGRTWIPERIYTKPPSAELAPGQVDEDSLPPYEHLDPFLDAYLVGGAAPEEAASGELVGPDWARRIERNEFKRVQAPPILRVSPKAFGRGRRMAIAKG